MIIASGAGSSLTGPSTVNILDAYLDFNPFGKDLKDLCQIRVGRFKTPFLYQFYKLGPQDFIAPELSMFGTNYLQNRQLGIMAHGALFQNRFDYAAGIFNGSPNTFEVAHSDREGILYAGLYPFLLQEESLLKNLIIAGAYAFGYENGPVIPDTLGTAVPSAGPANNLEISPTFLVFSPNAVQNGFRQFWNLDVIWSHRSFNCYGEYSAGNQTYGLTTAPGRSFPLSLSGYSLAATYFITGEQVSTLRQRVQPLRPYRWAGGGFGAFELFSRYSNLVLGGSVFSDNLADPALYANRVNALDNGVNWYLNQYIKLVFDWQHAMFNQPITLTGTPARTTKTEDLYWLRFQLYY